MFKRLFGNNRKKKDVRYAPGIWTFDTYEQASLGYRFVLPLGWEVKEGHESGATKNAKNLQLTEENYLFTMMCGAWDLVAEHPDTHVRLSVRVMHMYAPDAKEEEVVQNIVRGVRSVPTPGDVFTLESLEQSRKKVELMGKRFEEVVMRQNSSWGKAYITRYLVTMEGQLAIQMEVHYQEEYAKEAERVLCGFEKI